MRADTLRALRCTSDRRNIPVRLSVAIRRPLAKWPKAPYEAQPVSKVYFPQSPPPEQPPPPPAAAQESTQPRPPHRRRETSALPAQPQAPIRQDNPGSL